MACVEVAGLGRDLDVDAVVRMLSALGREEAVVACSETAVQLPQMENSVDVGLGSPSTLRGMDG